MGARGTWQRVQNKVAGRTRTSHCDRSWQGELLKRKATGIFSRHPSRWACVCAWWCSAGCMHAAMCRLRRQQQHSAASSSAGGRCSGRAAEAATSRTQQTQQQRPPDQTAPGAEVLQLLLGGNQVHSCSQLVLTCTLTATASSRNHVPFHSLAQLGVLALECRQGRAAHNGDLVTREPAVRSATKVSCRAAVHAGRKLNTCLTAGEHCRLYPPNDPCSCAAAKQLMQPRAGRSISSSHAQPSNVVPCPLVHRPSLVMGQRLLHLGRAAADIPVQTQQAHL